MLIFPSPYVLAAGGGTDITLVSETAFTLAVGASTETKTFTALEDDLVLVYLANDGANDAAPYVTSGFAIVYDGFAATNPSRGIGWKIMTSTPDTGIEVKQQGVNISAGIIQVWRNVDTTTPFDGVTVTASTGTPIPQNKTSLTDNAMSIVTHWLDDDDMAGTGTAPTGWGGLFQADTGQASTSSGCTISTAYKQLGVAGETNPSSFGFTDLSTDAEATSHMILRKAT